MFTRTYKLQIHYLEQVSGSDKVALTGVLEHEGAGFDDVLRDCCNPFRKFPSATGLAAHRDGYLIVATLECKIYLKQD